jgi:hypothetical protein
MLFHGNFIAPEQILVTCRTPVTVTQRNFTKTTVAAPANGLDFSRFSVAAEHLNTTD